MCAFFLGTNYQQMIDINSQQQITIIPTINKPKIIPQSPTPFLNNPVSATSPDQTTQNFYNWYLSCMDNFNQSPHLASTNPYPLTYQGALTNDVVTKLQNPSNYDKILCAQNTPRSLKFDKAVLTSSNTASIVIHTIWGEETPQAVQVGLLQVNNEWKISSITCNLSSPQNMKTSFYENCLA
jgi:hypothetical protein